MQYLLTRQEYEDLQEKARCAEVLLEVSESLIYISRNIGVGRDGEFGGKGEAKQLEEYRKFSQLMEVCISQADPLPALKKLLKDYKETEYGC